MVTWNQLASLEPVDSKAGSEIRGVATMIDVDDPCQEGTVEHWTVSGWLCIR
jgi:hypothetical protein